MLTSSGLTKQHGDRVLLDGVTITLSPGRRMALVGGNGAGKTTLAEILLGIQEPDAGDVHRPSGLTFGYLPQDLPGTAAGSVLEEVLAGDEELAALAHRLTATTDALRANPDDEGLLAGLGEDQTRFEQLGGYAREAEAHRVLAGLGFATTDADRAVKELSGGWRMRVALARLLVARPDVLVLDEPTNHLDVDSVAWLERYLQEWSGALLFVSHDRDFIDAVANRVVELAGGTATEYVGGFAEFVAQREERLAQAEAAAAAQARQRAHTERFIERFRYKATKSRQVQSRVKALERLEEIPVPTRDELRLRFAFPEPPPSSRVVAELVDVTAGYDDEVVLTDVNLVVERGRKVALVGPNGAGKTTLLRLLTGEIEALGGSCTLGGRVTMARFAQHQAEVLDPERTVLAEFNAEFDPAAGDATPGWSTAQGKARNPRTVLGTFGFSGDAVDRRVAELSGGEATRLALAKTLANPVSLLVLDEPTNHLDLPSCDLLEDALVAYPGTVLLVTHDRHLIRGVADALVEVRNGTARWHEGVPEEVLTPGGSSTAATPADETRSRPRPQMHSSRRSERSAPPAAADTRRRRGAPSPRDKRRAAERAERRWEQAEAEVSELQRQLADPELYADPEAARGLVARFEEAKDRANDAMEVWERLTEAAGDP
ncbi:MAG: ABC-F family ATP-binding cassette domain-containing protein [Acidimicrobiia bacterium]|nr:ABC-F family ATP-binding cassette domain-containing protein [Acidimicrobiia bacterium]